MNQEKLYYNNTDILVLTLVYTFNILKLKHSTLYYIIENISDYMIRLKIKHIVLIISSNII